MESRKNPAVDIDKKRGFFFAVGLTVAFSFMLVAFEWKSFKEVVLDQFVTVEMDNSVEEIAPIIIPQNTPPPPPAAPPPPVIEELELVEDDVEVEDVTVDVQAPDEISAPVVTNTQVEENVNDNEVFIAVEDMPRYKGCEGIKDNDAAFECFQKEVGKFLGKNINYPQKAKEANVEGVVYVNFVVDQTGKVADVKLLRGIGFGCDEEATRVVKLLPQFTPGKQRGRAVKVSFNLPISFKLR